MSHILDLPDELLRNIFEYLPFVHAFTYGCYVCLAWRPVFFSHRTHSDERYQLGLLNKCAQIGDAEACEFLLQYGVKPVSQILQAPITFRRHDVLRLLVRADFSDDKKKALVLGKMISIHLMERDSLFIFLDELKRMEGEEEALKQEAEEEGETVPQ